jgi:hypothetical protein
LLFEKTELTCPYVAGAEGLRRSGSERCPCIRKQSQAMYNQHG